MIGKEARKHIVLNIILIIIILIFFSEFLLSGSKINYGVIMNYYTPFTEVYKISVQKYHDFLPLWEPYIMSGRPYFGSPGIQMFYLLNLFGFIFPHMIIAVKMVAIVSIIFAAISMYILAYYLIKDYRAAFVSALLFVFNGWTLSRLKSGHITTLAPLLFLPLIVLFTLKALKSKEWIKYSVITGILLAIQMLAGPDLKVTLWTFPLIGLCLLFYLNLKHFTKRLIKALLIVSIILIIGFGITAIKILPTYEFLQISARKRMAFDLTLAGKVISFKEGFSQLVEPIYEDMPKFRGANGYQIGIIGFLLMCFGIWKNSRKKTVLLFTSMIIFSLFIVTGSFVWYLMWKYLPAYPAFRYLHRTVIMFVFAASVLAGFGVYSLLKFLEKKGLPEKKQFLVFILVVILIITNLCIFGAPPYRARELRDPYESIKHNELLQYLSKQEGIFRIHVLETKGIDHPTEFQYIPYDLKIIYGGTGTWLYEYMNEFLAIALQQPAKFLGILNVKYITSQKELNITGLKFVKKFNRCAVCWPDVEQIQKIWGPYLYENQEFLAGTYLINNGLLIIGEKTATKQLMYEIMSHPNFDPSRLIIILGNKPKVSDYNIEFLKNFKTIIITQGSVDQNSHIILQEYINSGGILLPNILEGKNTITSQNIENLFDYSKSNFIPIEDKNVITHNFDKKEVKLDKNEDNFLVLSERYSLFPGWKATASNKKLEILRVNGVVSAVYLGRDYDNVIFEYKPTSFKIGSIITIITLLIICTYFTLMLMKKRREDSKTLAGSSNENQNII